MTGKTETPIDSMSFEQALAELENIVRRLESGEIPLEESIESYKRGQQLKAHCEARLQSARMQVEQVAVGPDGAVSLSPFDDGGAQG